MKTYIWVRGWVNDLTFPVHDPVHGDAVIQVRLHKVKFFRPFWARPWEVGLFLTQGGAQCLGQKGSTSQVNQKNEKLTTQEINTEKIHNTTNHGYLYSGLKDELCVINVENKSVDICNNIKEKIWIFWDSVV